jgi:hypothetical protein
MVIWSDIYILFSRDFIFCKYLNFNQITSIQSGTFNGMPSLYSLKVSSSLLIPCCNLQSMIMHVQYFFLFRDCMSVVIMKTKCKLLWSTVPSISTKRTITPKTPHHISVSAIIFNRYT